MPTEKYAHAPEILEHCQRIGKQFGLYDNALFHTEVTDLEWDDDRSRVDHPHQPRRRVHRPVPRPWAPGRCTCPKLPGIPGLEDFQGHSFHTSRWDYDYTGGDPVGRADGQAGRQAGRRSSAPAPPSVQCVPHLARACQELYVFQRTPSSVDVRDNRPTDPEWFATINTPGLAAAVAGELHRQPDRRHGRGGPGDGRLDRPGPPHPQQDHGAAAGGVHPRGDDGGLRGLRLREDGGDPGPGRHDRRGPGRRPQNLKAWYRQLCKRPCFHDEYLQAFNEPGTPPRRHRRQGRRAHHRDGRRGRRAWSTRSTASSTRRASRWAPTYTRRAGYDMTGRDGVKLSRALGRRHAHQARHPRARLPERCSSCSPPRAPT